MTEPNVREGKPTQADVDRVGGSLAAYLYEYETVDDARVIWSTFAYLVETAGFDAGSLDD